MQTARNRLTFVIATAALLAALLSLGAQFAGAQHAAAPNAVGSTVPNMVSYQGRVLNGGSPVNGVGFFKFAIVNGSGAIFWTNDGTSAGAGGEPTAAVAVTVMGGLFTVLLGDTSLGGMSVPLTATVFADADRRLRIWFSPSNSGFTQLGPDQPLTTAPFAFNAQTLGGLDASTFVQQSELAAGGFVTQGQADGRYARISPTTQQLALLKWYTAIRGTQADFGVGNSPRGIAFDGANMWVANYFSSNVSVLRASDGFHIMTPTVGANPIAIAFDGANMWVVNTGSSSVSVLRASDGFHVMTPTVGANPIAIAFDGANMWVAALGSASVSVLRASDGSHVMTPTVGASPRGIAFDGANMWVANNSSNSVSVLRGSDGFHIMTPTVGANPRGIAFDGANMWVSNASDNNVSVLRASDGFHVMTPTVGANPFGIAFDGANMWVANQNDNTVSVLRASDGFLVTTVTVGSNPQGIAFDGAFMWVANSGSSSVSKR
jgi:YVTN family beta-propeller protein